MTISRKQQEVEERELLSAVLKSVGDDLLETKFLEKPDFSGYHETTWLHFFQRGLLEDMGQKGIQTFTMTPIGWIGYPMFVLPQKKRLRKTGVHLLFAAWKDWPGRRMFLKIGLRMPSKQN